MYTIKWREGSGSSIWRSRKLTPTRPFLVFHAKPDSSDHTHTSGEELSPSADFEPHHFGKPAPRAFQFGMVEFLRSAFGLPTVQSKSLVNMCPVSSSGANH